jgi:hypothetical protein
VAKLGMGAIRRKTAQLSIDVDSNGHPCSQGAAADDTAGLPDNVTLSECKRMPVAPLPRILTERKWKHNLLMQRGMA